MSPAEPVSPVLEADWLGFCRRAGVAARTALAPLVTQAERRRQIGRGAGGDMSLAVDTAAEDAIFAELDAFGVAATAISEERGHVEVAGGGDTFVVIDPIDGSLNAGRGLHHHCISIAVASGPTMGDVSVGYVLDLPSGEEWWALRGGGAFVDGERLGKVDAAGELELLAIESANPKLIAPHADALAESGARRLRALGAIALTMCNVAAGRIDAMLSLAPCRSVDAAAGQLIVREAGGVVAFPDAAGDPLAVSLDLEMRSRVVAAPSQGHLQRLVDGVFSVWQPG